MIVRRRGTRTGEQGRPAGVPLSEAVADLIAAQRPDPRLAQGVVLVPVLLEVVLHALTRTPLDAFLGTGCLLVGVASLGAWVIGTGRLGARWAVLVPALDIVAVGVMRLAPDTAVGVAVVFPALWLGLQFGRRGVGLTTLLVLAVLVVPTVWRMGPTVAALSKISQLSLMAVVASVVVCLSAELWAEQVRQREEAHERLEQAVADLTEQRRLTRTIVHGVDVGLVSIDPRGVYDAMNPRQAEFLALAFPGGHHGRAGQPGFVYAEDGVTLLPGDQAPTVRAQRGEAFRDEVIWVGRDPAHRRALAVSATPYLHADGTPGGAVLAYHDITALVTASRVKEDFVASVSHELRTPLTSIAGYVDVVLDDVEDLPPIARQHLETVQRNAGRLHRLVDDLLSSAEQGHAGALEVERVRLLDVVRRSVRDAVNPAEAKGLTLWLDHAGGPEEALAEVEGDPGRLAQVLDNLLGNAVKYTPPGGLVVCSLAVEGDEVVVRVRDSGRGIDAQEQDAIFNKFFRSSAVVGEAIPGVGLGLAIAKSIVDAHGGSLGVTSAAGRGATFQVRLPRAVAAPLERAEAPAEVPAGDTDVQVA